LHNRKIPTDARSLAANALDEIERRGAYADQFLDSLFRREKGLDPRERGLVTALVYGVLRRRNLLDAAIRNAYQRPLKKLHPALLTILRTGAFQLLYFDRIPAPVAVSETVELAVRSGHAKARGLVNALMRKISSVGMGFPRPEGFDERIGLETGFPAWIIEHWRLQEGEEGAKLMAEGFGAVPPVFLRVDTGKISREEALASLGEKKEAGPGDYSPQSIWLCGGGDLRELDLLKKGLAVAQGQASQLVSLLLAPVPGWRMLDACAAPGIKATHLASLMEDKGEIIALDIHPGRVNMIGELAGKLGLGSIKPLLSDAALYRDDALFDGVLVDAPCSGLGVLAHNPEKRWRLTPAELSGFPPLQERVLENAAKMVKPGGVLVYATCTTARAENEEAVKAFLGGNPSFALESAAGFISPRLVTAEGFVKTFPSPPAASPGGYLEGFFAARMRRSR
jgi:16S rRNA (cytosine967-C5)-methyltransferase